MKRKYICECEWCGKKISKAQAEWEGTLAANFCDCEDYKRELLIRKLKRKIRELENKIEQLGYKLKEAEER